MDEIIDERFFEQLPNFKFNALMEKMLEEKERRANQKIAEKRRALYEIEKAFDAYYRQFGYYPVVQFETYDYAQVANGVRAEALINEKTKVPYLLLKEDCE